MSPHERSYSVLMSVYEHDHPDYADAAIRSMVEQSAPFTDLVIVCDGPVGADLDAVIERWRGELGERLRVHRLADSPGPCAPACRCAAPNGSPAWTATTSRARTGANCCSTP